MFYSAVIFDWDGTLMDSTAKIVQSMQSAAAEFGLPVPEAEAIRSLIGLGMAEVLEELFPPLSKSESLQFRSCYRKHFVSPVAPPANLYEGARALLELLHAAGIKLAVATGKGRRGLDEMLAETGFGEYFTVTRCAEETRSKPHPQMLTEILDELGLTASQSLMVGDTEFDVLMAQAASMDVCALTHGAHELDRLSALQPTLMMDDLVSLGAWIEENLHRNTRVNPFTTGVE